MGDEIVNDAGSEIVEESAGAEDQVVEEFNNDPLGDVFPDRHPLSEMGEKKEEPETPAAEVEPKVEEKPEPVTEPVIDPAIDAMQKEIAAFKAKALDETKKRQDLELAIAEQNKKPDEFDWDNPEKTIAAAVDKVRQEAQTNILNMSEAHCKSRHKDYDAKYEVFVQMAQENPSIIKQMISQVDPAEYAYNLATQRMFSDEVGKDPKSYEEKLRARHRLEFEAEMKTKTDGRQALADSLPPSAKSMTDKNTPVDTVDDDPLGSLFPGEVAS